MNVDYNVELQIIKLIRKMMDKNIHGTVFNASLGSKKKIIKKVIPAIDKAEEYLIEHYKNMSHSLIKDDFKSLSDLVEKYKKKCQEIARSSAVDVSDMDELNSLFSDIIDFMNVIEGHTNIALKK